MGTLCCVLSGFCIFFSLQLTSKFKFTIFLIFNIIHIDYKVKKVCNIIQSIYVRIQRYILQKLNKVYKYIKKNIDFFGGGDYNTVWGDKNEKNSIIYYAFRMYDIRSRN